MAEEEVLTVVFRGEPVIASNEEGDRDRSILQRDLLGFILRMQPHSGLLCLDTCVVSVKAESGECYRPAFARISRNPLEWRVFVLVSFPHIIQLVLKQHPG